VGRHLSPEFKNGGRLPRLVTITVNVTLTIAFLFLEEYKQGCGVILCYVASLKHLPETVVHYPLSVAENKGLSVLQVDARRNTTNWLYLKIT
jgi:hypothetical protein